MYCVVLDAWITVCTTAYGTYFTSEQIPSVGYGQDQWLIVIYPAKRLPFHEEIKAYSGVHHHDGASSVGARVLVPTEGSSSSR